MTNDLVDFINTLAFMGLVLIVGLLLIFFAAWKGWGDR